MINLLIALFLMVIVCLFVATSIFYVRANRFQNAALKWKSRMWLPTFQSRREYDIDFGFKEPLTASSREKQLSPKSNTKKA